MKVKHPVDKTWWKSLYTPRSFMLMLTGVALAIFALKGFILPNDFLDGGVTGISLLLHAIFHDLDFSLVFIILNLFIIYPTSRLMGRAFALKSFIVILLVSFGAHYLPIPTITNESLLVAVFGGGFLGVGMGLVIRSGAAMDGFEILAIYTIRKVGFSMSEVILFFNSIIFLVSASKFGVDKTLYAIITFYAALRAMDYVVEGIDECIALNVISKESGEIKSLLVNRFGKGITVYKGERGYLPGQFEVHTDCDVIVTIVTRLELLHIKEKIAEIDEKAFIYTYTVKETRGGILKKKATH